MKSQIKNKMSKWMSWGPWCKENKTLEKQQRRSVSVDIVDSDIATIEALHDLLLDAHGYSLDFITLKRARELIAKMYKARA